MSPGAGSAATAELAPPADDVLAPLEVDLVLLGDDGKKEADLKAWSTALCGQDSPSSRPIKTRTVKPRPAKAIEEQIGSGRPFVLVGPKVEIEKVFEFVSKDDLLQDCLCDHAYWWIRTDSEPSLPRWLGFDGERQRADIVLVEKWGSNQLARTVRQRLDILAATPDLRGLSRGMHGVRRKLLRIARGVKTPGPLTSVLILGPSGGGKEAMARTLCRLKFGHDGRALATVACGQMDDNQLISEVFGHVKGAFTGATADRTGLLACATDHRGVFFDDLENAPDGFRGALLRVMQTGDYRRMGGDEVLASDQWLLFATNKPIRDLVGDDGRWADFFFRFEDRVVAIPELSARLMDLPALARTIWDEQSAKKERKGRRLGAETLRTLLAAVRNKTTTLKGNVRALRTLLAMVFDDSLDQEALEMPRLLAAYLAPGGAGSEYWDWVGISAHDRAAEPVVNEPSPPLDTASAEAFRTFVAEYRDRHADVRWTERMPDVRAFLDACDRYDADAFLKGVCLWLCPPAGETAAGGLRADALEAALGTLDHEACAGDVARLLLLQSLRPQTKARPFIDACARRAFNNNAKRAHSAMLALQRGVQAGPPSALASLVALCPCRKGTSFGFILKR